MSIEIRMQADDFFNAYQVLKENYVTETLSIMGPSIVCLAFATELYIKDLHFVLKGKAPRGHNILKLFEKLPEPIRKDIFTHDSISQNPFMTRENLMSSKYFSRDYSPYERFSDQIKEISDAFIKWRYPYERERESLYYNSAFVLDLIKAIKSVSDNIHAQSAA